MPKFYLTTPIYYVNAPAHIGHAYTTLAADVIARHYRKKLGEESVFFLTGTDEHGAKIAEAAQTAGKTPKEFCDEMAPLFAKTWKRLNVSYDHFIRTTDDYHEKSAAEFLTTLKVKGALYEGDYTGLYCNGCESFITEKQLTENGLCKDHLRAPERIVEKNWFFNLQTYLPKVKKIIEDGKLRVLPEAKTEEVLGLFRQSRLFGGQGGMENFSVSRPNVKWGIPLPWDRSQTIYVWVEALLNYWTAVHKYQMFWPPDLQIIGKDIIKFHCIYWPALLLAYYDGDAEQLPKTIFAHGFFTVNGQKMSKTLQNVIDPNDLALRYGEDGARYLILSQFPFGADGDIEEGKFTVKYNADLANGVGNLVSRVATLCVKQITDRGEFWKQALTNYELRIKNDADDALIEQLKLFERLQLIVREIQLCDEHLANKQPWKLEKEKQQKKIIELLADAVAGILLIAKHCAPFLPNTSAEITKRFNAHDKKIIIGDSLFPRK